MRTAEHPLEHFISAETAGQHTGNSRRSLSGFSTKEDIESWLFGLDSYIRDYAEARLVSCAIPAPFRADDTHASTHIAEFLEKRGFGVSISSLVCPDGPPTMQVTVGWQCRYPKDREGGD